MGVQYTNNTTPKEKDNAEVEVKEDYIACLMMDGAENGSFGTIETYLENKMDCRSYSYKRSKDKP